jgi:hypothetical protein
MLRLILVCVFALDLLGQSQECYADAVKAFNAGRIPEAKDRLAAAYLSIVLARRGADVGRRCGASDDKTSSRALRAGSLGAPHGRFLFRLPGWPERA